MEKALEFMKKKHQTKIVVVFNQIMNEYWSSMKVLQKLLFGNPNYQNDLKSDKFFAFGP